MPKKLVSLAVLGALSIAPHSSAQASGPMVKVQGVQCRDEMTLLSSSATQPSICWGYDKARQTTDPSKLETYQPTPFNVEEYLTIAISLDAPIRVSLVTVYVKPAAGTVPEWTPAVAQAYESSSPVSSVAIHNTYSNAFPLIAKKCAKSESAGTRRFLLYIEVWDQNGGIYPSNWLDLYIDPEGIVNPPVNEYGERCTLYLP